LAAKGPGYAKVEITLPFSEEEKKHHDFHNTQEAASSQTKIFHRKADQLIDQDIYANPIFKLFEYLKNLPTGVALLSLDAGTSADVECEAASLEIDLSAVMKESSIGRLLKISEALKILSAELKTIYDPDCQPSYSTMTLGQIRTYPEDIKILGTCRLIPVKGRDHYEQWLEGLRQGSAAAGASLRILDYKSPFISPQEGPLLEMLKSVCSDLDMNDQSAAAPISTEASVFQRLGIDALAFGPGEMPNSAATERLKLVDLTKAQEFYNRIFASYKL
jgi:succinyl-diaminopimelate desuccinylase